MGTLHEDQYTSLIISRSVLLRLRMIKNYRDNQNTHFMFNNFFSENRVLYEIMWKNMVERGRPHMTIWRMGIACCTPKATNTHSGYVIIISFPLQQYLQKWASALRHPHTACLVFNSLKPGQVHSLL